MAFSRRRSAESGTKLPPGLRLTQDLDFQKDRAGEVEVPVVGDDMDIWEFSAKSLLALLDMKANESMTRERYTERSSRASTCVSFATTSTARVLKRSKVTLRHSM